MPTYRLATIFWLLMLALTCISAYYAEQPHLSLGLIGLVLFLTVVKACLIVDHFMCLRGAPLFWRGALMAYVPLISLVITATYAIDFT